MINVAHKALQCSAITLSKAGAIVERLAVNFRNRRCHNKFVELYLQAEELCKCNGLFIAPLPVPSNTCERGYGPTTQGAAAATAISHRTVKTPSSLREFFIATTLGQRESIDNSADAHHGLSELRHSPLFDQLYLPVCDTLIGQLEFRFDKESLIMAKSVDAVLHCKSDGIKALVDKYANILDINHQVLASEMELFSSTDNEITFDVIQKELTKDVYPQYYRMVQLALTLPVGSATAERSFSSMRRIRNWLRSTMGQERFSSLALLNIECDLTAALVPEDLVLTYASCGTRRLKLH
jgi:hAT family C-terminal dimerisation region